jgi:hypothetical protein
MLYEFKLLVVIVFAIFVYNNLLYMRMKEACMEMCMGMEFTGPTCLLPLMPYWFNFGAPHLYSLSSYL